MDAHGEVLAASYGRNSSKIQQAIKGQLAGNRKAAEERAWKIVAELSDGSSASRYATKERDKWAELLALVPSIQVVLLWEASRGDRTLGSWVGFLDLCRANGVMIHATGHGSTYDPRKARDYRTLAEDGVDAAYESDKTSMRLLRGFAAAAASGRPHARALYGYERIYDGRSGVFVEQRPHPVHAEIVREIVRRIGRGDAVMGVAKDLTRRGVPAPAGATRWVQEMLRRSRKGERAEEIGVDLVARGILTLGPGGPAAADVVSGVLTRFNGGDDEPEKARIIGEDLAEAGVLDPAAPWKTATVTAIARNRAYLGLRVHRARTGETTEHPGLWPALVTDAEFHAVARVLSAPDRVPFRGPRPGRATSLLGNLLFCGTCGARMSPKSKDQYRCCVNIGRDELEDLVTEVVVARLSQPDVYRQLRHASDGDDRAVIEAQAEVDTLTGDLATWRQSAIEGKTTPDSLAVIEAGIAAKIRDAQRRAERTGVPPVLRQFIEPGADIRERWKAASLAARREVVKILMTVTVHSSRVRGRALTDRVDIVWRTA